VSAGGKAHGRTTRLGIGGSVVRIQAEVHR
jgi:hypothetical protein